jgi:sensor histidine kinase YesM
MVSALCNAPRQFLRQEILVMPITIQEIKEYYDQFGLHDMSSMPTFEYRQALANGGLLWIDHHDFVRSTLSEEILATNREQLEALIKHLQSFSGKMSP